MVSTTYLFTKFMQILFKKKNNLLERRYTIHTISTSIFFSIKIVDLKMHKTALKIIYKSLKLHLINIIPDSIYI